MLDFHFIPFDANVVHRIVHVYTPVFGAQPHGRFALEIHRIRGVHAVRYAIVTRVFVVVLVARRTTRVPEIKTQIIDRNVAGIAVKIRFTLDLPSPTAETIIVFYFGQNVF